MPNEWFHPKPYSFSIPGVGVTYGSRPDPSADPEVLKTLYAQPGQFAGALSNNYTGYSQGMAGLGNAMANAYGAYNFGLGNVATARANEAGARYGANAMAEAARQGAMGNIGSAALGAYGGASNSALAAWAANQQAYNNAAASMHNANQQGMSQYGQSRNAALGGLGNAYSGIGRAQLASDAIGNINLSGNLGGGSGNGFNATGPGGTVASGSYGGGTGPGGFSLSGSRSSRSSAGGTQGALSGLGGLQNNLMAGDITASLDRGADAGRRQLDAQHYSSRGMPSQMLGQTLGGLLQLGGQAYGESSRGMDQFYGNTQMNERPYENILGQMGAGYATVGDQLGGVQRDMGTGFNTANSTVRGLFDDSLGQLPMFSSPAQNMRRQREATELQRRYDAEDEAYRNLQSASFYAGRPMGDYFNNQARRAMDTYANSRQFMGGYR